MNPDPETTEPDGAHRSQNGRCVMFEGPNGKALMIQQGYVPPTCTLPVELAGPLIWDETHAGRDVCAGCSHDRAECHGRPEAIAEAQAEPTP